MLSRRRSAAFLPVLGAGKCRDRGGLVRIVGFSRFKVQIMISETRIRAI